MSPSTSMALGQRSEFVTTAWPDPALAIVSEAGRTTIPEDAQGHFVERLLRRSGHILRLAVPTILRRRPPVEAVQERVHEASTVLQDISRGLLGSHGVETCVRGTVPTGPVILASNHVGYLDPIVIAALKPCIIIAKSSVASWPVIGWGARTLGVLWVDREKPGGGQQSLRGARRALDHGVSVLNFCEGTTTDGTEVRPFKLGIFRLAQRGGYPVVPVSIRFHDPRMAWTDDATFVPHYAQFAARTRTRVDLTFGPAILPQVAPDAASLAEVTRAAVRSQLGLT